MKLNRQNILIGILIVLLIYAGYHFYAKNSTSGGVSIDVSSYSSTEPVGLDILVLVQKLETISIDPSVLSGALFTSLKDLSIPLTPESQYRLDPFAPIGSGSSAGTAVSGNSRIFGR